MATAKSKSHHSSRSERPAESPVEQTEALDTGFKAAEAAVMSGTEAAFKSYETAVAASCEALDAACRAAKDVDGFAQASGLPRESFDAFMDASNATVRGLQAVNQHLVDCARVQLSEGAAAQRALMGAKSLHEAVEIQQAFVRKSIDRAMQDGAELSTIWFKAANGVLDSAGHAARRRARETHEAA
jgi:hypothetical protein